MVPVVLGDEAKFRHVYQRGGALGDMSPRARDRRCSPRDDAVARGWLGLGTLGGLSTRAIRHDTGAVGARHLDGLAGQVSVTRGDAEGLPVRVDPVIGAIG